jgi:tRNA-dihydrouridine synthase B
MVFRQAGSCREGFREGDGMEWKIRDVAIPNQTVLGPMAGVTDLPFRLLCREQGAGLTVMEMVSAKAITFHNYKTAELMKTEEAERPVSLQLFGHEPEVMGEALDLIRDQTFDILDINMGCPVSKIVNNQEGSALMKSPELIEKIVKTCTEHTSRPVTVKMRTGYDHDHQNVVECALAAEAGGASMVAVHGRTRPQMYSGRADWSKIAEVVRAVKIPVVGNGDVTDGPSAKRMLEETGCTAVMIGRAAEGNPWIFREVNHYLETGELLEKPGHREVIQMLLRHAALMKEIKGERIGIQEMHHHAAWYLQGFPGAAKLRVKINTMSSFAELEDMLRREFPYAVSG